MKIYAALREHIGEGFVWLENAQLPPRCVVKITHGRKSVFCEALQFDKNFLSYYNNGSRRRIDAPSCSIVMNGRYRARLGDLETKKDYPLKIAKANRWWGKIRSCMQHPQIVVHVAVWFGIASVGFGLLSVAIGVASAWPRGCV